MWDKKSTRPGQFNDAAWTRHPGRHEGPPVNPRGYFRKFPGLKAVRFGTIVSVQRMRAILYAQFIPAKTLQQLVADRAVYVRLLLIGLVMILCG